MSRSRMCRRLEKLEATSAGRSWNDKLGEVHELALSKLSPADRDLLPEATAHRHADLTDAHRAVWARWEVAFAEAIVETRFPVNLTAEEMLF